MPEESDVVKPIETKRPISFRREVFRGLGIVMPPLLTIVLFMWVWNAVELNVVQPSEAAVHRLFVWYYSDVVDTPPAGTVVEPLQLNNQRLTKFTQNEVEYVGLGDGRFVPREHYEEFVSIKGRKDRIPNDADEFYKRLALLKYPRRYLLPLAVVLFVLQMYVLGRFVAFSLGHVLWRAAESVVNRLPIIRNVYSSVKRVTDLVFSESEEGKFTRVVAVEYPRKGAWALAFVTGEGFADVRAVVKDPIVALLIPTSPMPAAGFTMMCRKSDTVDLNISIDQAIQFIVSCGVISPPYTYPPDSQRISQQVIDAVHNKADKPAPSADS